MSTNTPYEFDKQLALGKQGEAWLDALFTKRGAHVRAVDMDQQRSGIDREFIIPGGRRYTVEYKTDLISIRSGCMFLELVSNTVTGKCGWLFTTQADYLVYHAIGVGVYLMVPTELVDWYLLNTHNYVVLPVRNTTYSAIGAKVPIKHLTKAGIARQIAIS